MKHIIDDKIFHVLSLEKAKAFKNDTPWACISVTDWDDFPVLSEENRIGLLQLRFPDWDKPDFAQERFMFNADKAKQAREFVDEMWDKTDTFMIHCYAGISRSAALAASISKVKLGVDNTFFKLHMPNMLVYRKMMEAYER